MKKTKDEKPFTMAMSKEQQKYIKDIKEQLIEYLNSDPDENNYEIDQKQRLIIKALFQLPVIEQNLYLVKTYGEYPSVSELARQLHITKQTLCSHIRQTKTYIKHYVTDNYIPYTD